MQFRHVLLLLFFICSIQAVAAQSPAWQYHAQNERISSIDISSDGTVIAAGSMMGTLAVFDKAGAPQWSEKVSGALLVDVAPDGSMIVTASRESMENDKGVLRVYDLTGRERWMNNTGWAAELAAAGDPLRIVVGTRQGAAMVFDAKGTLVKTFSTYPFLDVVKELGISSDGKSIAFSTFKENTPMFKIINISKSSIKSPAIYGNHVALSANGSAIAVAEGEGSLGRLHLYNAAGTDVWMLDTGEVNDLAISGDGTCLVTGGEDGTVVRYDGTGNVSWTFRAGGPVNSIAMTPDATLVAVGSSDEHIYLLDDAGKLLWDYNDDEPLENPVDTVKFSADGSMLVAVIDGKDLLAFPIDRPAVAPTQAAPAGNGTANATPGNTSINSTLLKGNVTANSTLPKGNVSANSTPVTGTASVNSTLTKGNVTANSTQVTGNASINSTLLKGNTSINSSLLKGNVSVNSTFPNSSLNSTPPKGNTPANSTPAKGTNTSVLKTSPATKNTSVSSGDLFASLRYPGRGSLSFGKLWEQLLHFFTKGP